MMNENEDKAKVGLLFIQAKVLEAEAKAAEYRAKLLSDLALTITYTIEKSESDLDPELSAQFLPGAKLLLEGVKEAELVSWETSANQNTHATQLIDKAKEISDVCEWPEVIGSR